MNITNLNQLLTNYMNDFDYINNETHREYYKWEAVRHFQNHWDIDAPDFANMFKESVREAYNLINNHIVQPTTGIVKLAERPELTEQVRRMFKDLLADDQGDIDKRQDKIYSFLGQAENFLNTYEKGKWKYAQDMRTVISYLSFLEPSKNYMFKATQAKEFMYCTEYPDDFGSGENFNLKKYYGMCDELVSAIKETPELIKLHTERLTEKMWTDDDYHILAYDIIYSAILYKLYTNITIVKPIRSKAQLREQQIQAKREQLTAELNQVKNELDDALLERSEYDNFSVTGLIVTHKVFGEGTVTAHNGGLIDVQFVKAEKRFQLPQAISNGFLKTDSEEVSDIFNNIDALDNRISKLRQAEFRIEDQLEKLK